jgi:hypothetical protein
MTGTGAFSLDIDWSVYERMVGQLEGVPDKVVELIARDLAVTLAKEAPAGVTGLLKSRWKTRKVTRGEWAVQTPQTYAAAVNDGTKPHAPPMDAIKEWAEFRGLPWFPVWLSIVRKGTKANPFIDRAMDTTNGRIPLFVNQAMKEIGG